MTFKITWESVGRNYNCSSALPVQCPNCKIILPSRLSALTGRWHKKGGLQCCCTSPLPAPQSRKHHCFSELGNPHTSTSAVKIEPVSAATAKDAVDEDAMLKQTHRMFVIIRAGGGALHLDQFQHRALQLSAAQIRARSFPGSLLLCSWVRQHFCLCGEKYAHKGMSFATYRMNGKTLHPLQPSSIDLKGINPTAAKKTRGPYLLPQPWEGGSSEGPRTRWGNNPVPANTFMAAFLETAAGLPGLSWTPALSWVSLSPFAHLSSHG